MRQVTQMRNIFFQLRLRKEAGNFVECGLNVSVNNVPLRIMKITILVAGLLSFLFAVFLSLKGGESYAIHSLGFALSSGLTFIAAAICSRDGSK